MNKKVGVTYSEPAKVRPYVSALEAAGVEPVLISAGSPQSLTGLDGLLLTGGADLNPAIYGQSRHPLADEPDDARDRLEIDLLKEALDQDIPVLAICRGMQLFNVACGGTLSQHIDTFDKHQRYDVPKKEPVHKVNVEPGSLLDRAVGAPSIAVNSRHHQAVGELGQTLVVSGRDEDGLVEAIERPDRRFALGVQWHPEDQAASDEFQKELFARFASAL